MTRTSPRCLAAAALVWATLAVVPASGAPLRVCGPGGTIEDVGGGWIMSHPAFPAGPAQVTLIASPPFDPNLIYATNGVALMRSRDAGCSWKSVYQTNGSVLQGEGTITALTVPSSANNSSFVYLGVTYSQAGVETPAIFTSTKYGDEWASTGEGLGELGRVREIAVNPTVQIVAYAVLETRVGDVVNTASLYATTDGGETWAERTSIGGGFTPHGLIVDPVVNGTVYALDGGKVVRSQDNALSFEPTEGDPGVAIDELSAAPGKGSLRLAGNRGDGLGIARSDDSGKTWRSLATPVPPRSVAMAPLQDVVAVSSGAEVWLLAFGQVVPVTPAEGGAPMQLSVTSPTQNGYGVTGVASGAVVRASFQGTTVVDPPGGRPIMLLPARGVTQFPSMLVPHRLTVKLAAGETRRVPYRLVLPRTPTAVDVMFLLDSTGSYQGVIDTLREAVADIVNVLNTAGLDVRFGVGNFEDYPPPYGSAEAQNIPYDLGRRIGPGDDEFEEALKAIVAHGGTYDGGQSSVTAIYQSVTGAGEVIRGRRVIDRGLDARFRPDALKLVMTSTDTKPHVRGERVPTAGGGSVLHPGPTLEQVMRELRSRGVRSLGIPTQQAAVDILERLAEASNARAPLGGVDCDGDGRLDLDTGDPLVCLIGAQGEGLAAAVVSTVAGIQDRKPVALRVTKGADRARLLKNVDRVVDLHADNELDYDLQVTCPRAAARNYDIALNAATPIRALAGGELTLSCGGLPGTEPEIFDANPVFPPRAAAANGVSDVSVTPQTNPNTNPNPQTHPNPNVNFNTGIVFQEEQQLQLALAGEQAFKPREELAMSDHRRMEPGAGFGAATAAMLAGAGAVATRRRRRTQVAAVRITR